MIFTKYIPKWKQPYKDDPQPYYLRAACMKGEITIYCHYFRGNLKTNRYLWEVQHGEKEPMHPQLVAIFGGSNYKYKKITYGTMPTLYRAVVAAMKTLTCTRSRSLTFQCELLQPSQILYLLS